MLRRILERFAPGGTAAQRAAHALYGTVVARARDPWLYARAGVPDTLDGRFEMLVWHLAPLVARLHRGGGEGPAVAQELFDAFLADMDAAMREEGVGDQAVPKRLQKMTRAFQGHGKALDDWRDDGRSVDALSALLERNVTDLSDGATLAACLEAHDAAVFASPYEELVAGRFRPVPLERAA